MTRNALRWVLQPDDPARQRSDAHDLARIQNVQGIERPLDARHQFERIVAVFFAQKIHLVHADTVLAGARAVHRQRARDDQLFSRSASASSSGFDVSARIAQ